MAPTIMEGLQYIADRLKAAGINASFDPQRIDLPSALVLPGPVEFLTLEGTALDLQVSIYLIARDRDTAETIRDLDTMLAAARPVLPQTSQAVPVALPLPNYNQTPLTALQLDTTIRIEE